MTDLADRFRREGIADAAVLLVAARIHPTTNLDDWGRALGLEHSELVAAVDRFKERRGDGRVCPHCGMSVLGDHIRRCLRRPGVRGRAV